MNTEKNTEKDTEKNRIPETTDVRKAHVFDQTKLLAYLRPRLASLDADVEIRQFDGGQSNPTFVVGSKNFGSEHQYVVRKKPQGNLLQSAHLIEREFKVMQALKTTDVAVPLVHLFCEDPDILGTPFYVMDYVPGRVFRDPKLPELSPQERATVYDAMNSMLTKLHKVNWKEVGLADFGKTENYVARQIARWSKQYEAAQIDPNPSMDKLMQWLPNNIPAGDAEGLSTTITHGDFRLENLIFAPDSLEIQAVLDWELSTLGHPFADLGYNCVVYHLPASIDGLSGIEGLDLRQLGIPDEKTYVETYKVRTDGDISIDHTFFVIFSLFRLASIVQGVLARARQGTASSQKAEQIGALAKPFANKAWQLTGAKN
jgi:aminoglycoside phosphotransferase (APT) family kinase protein